MPGLSDAYAIVNASVTYIARISHHGTSPLLFVVFVVLVTHLNRLDDMTVSVFSSQSIPTHMHCDQVALRYSHRKVRLAWLAFLSIAYSNAFLGRLYQSQ
jgi:hypothetical protein